MEVRLLNGQTAKIQLAKYQRGTESASKSQFQGRVGENLRKMFGFDVILEEVAIPGERFVIDFVIPSQHLAVECQGRQHDEFVPHFHGTRSGFNQQRARDTRKAEFCRLNGLVLVLVYPGQESQLGRLINEARRI